jgi:GT2 family glycosyltransferase
MSDKSVAVVVLTYNHAELTLACLESLARLDPPARWLIAVDNASPDGAGERLRSWGEDQVRQGIVASFHHCDVSKPAQGGPFCLAYPSPPSGGRPAPAHPDLYLVRSPENRGYAGGNNLGIVLALSLGADAVWLLNNDTLTDKAALGLMRDRLFAKARPGLCGSLVRYMDGGLVQCRAGGFTNKWTMLSRLDGNRLTLAEAGVEAPEDVEGRINFIYGASVMASREFLEQVGLLDERYFLYCEEQDWAFSAGNRFDLAYAPGALVLHKEGGSTGHSQSAVSAKSLQRLVRSRLLLALKHRPHFLLVLTVAASIAFAAARTVYRSMVRKKANQEQSGSPQANGLQRS